ncbi:hypothetical protein GCM10027184_10210 [Saccharothrix stipae]
MDEIGKNFRPTTPDEVEKVAHALEKLAAIVRKHAPSSVALDVAHRFVDMPPEDGYFQTAHAGLERVVVEVRW